MKRSQVLAARVLVRLAEHDGEPVDDDIKAAAAMDLDSPELDDAADSSAADSSTDIDRAEGILRATNRSISSYLSSAAATQRAVARAARQRSMGTDLLKSLHSDRLLGSLPIETDAPLSAGPVIDPPNWHLPRRDATAGTASNADHAGDESGSSR